MICLYVVGKRYFIETSSSCNCASSYVPTDGTACTEIQKGGGYASVIMIEKWIFLVAIYPCTYFFSWNNVGIPVGKLIRGPVITIGCSASHSINEGILSMIKALACRSNVGTWFPNVVEQISGVDVNNAILIWYVSTRTRMYIRIITRAYT